MPPQSLEAYVLGPVFGLVVGFSLGLTGGGGSIFAVPLLIYGLGLEAREAVGVSLAAVGSTALIGTLQRLRAREVEVGVGMLFALGGVAGAPAGSWLGRQLPADLLLLLFAALMSFVAARMWIRAITKPDEARVVRARLGDPPAAQGVTCRRDPSGRMRLTAPCTGAMAGAGALTGVLAGLFGVGGGFVIVPALIFIAGIDIHRAVATSLLAIALISGAGLAAHIAAGQTFAWSLIALFTAGGGAGLGLGMLLGRKISGPQLQKVFAGAIALVALFIAAKNLI